MRTTSMLALVPIVCVACGGRTGPLTTSVFSYSAAACAGEGSAFSPTFVRFLPRLHVLDTVDGRVVLDTRGNPEPETEKFPGFQAELFCPVVNEPGHANPAWSRLVLAYRDPQGQNPQLTMPRVAAQLAFLDDAGNKTSVATLNSSGTSQTQFGIISVNFSHAFDFSHRFYFVQVVIRANAGEPGPEVGGFRLESGPSGPVSQPN
jgi:hypothetical protein